AALTLGEQVGNSVFAHCLLPVSASDDGDADLAFASGHSATGTPSAGRATALPGDTSGLPGLDLRIADRGGTPLGPASGHTIRIDDNATGWGWFIDATPGDDSEFTTPGDQGDMHRIDLLTALDHEIGHLLGYPHTDWGLMNDTLAAGVRLSPVIDPST